MEFVKLAALILALGAGLASCNTTDTMTPPADVGDGSAMTTSGGTGTSYEQAASEPEQPFPAAPASDTMQSGAMPAQNSLDAQARSLAAGNGPMQPPPPVYGNGQQATLQQTAARQNALQQPSPMQQQQPPLQQQQPAPQQQQQTAVAPAGGPTIRFLPIIGAPVQAVTPLSRQLGADARANGLIIKGSGDPASDHILKGYFSAFSDAGKVNVVYVWDVLDANGGRLHRIQGQETFASAAGDPWAAVPPQLMQQIATKTIAEYMAWRRGSPG